MGDRSFPDFQAYLKVSDMVMIPMASLEQHGPHLPLYTDTITSIEVAKRTAEKARILYTPPIWMGYSPQHMRGPGEGTGTITVRPQTLLNLLHDVARSLIHHGFNKLIFVNGHGSNVKVIDPLLRKIRYDTGALVCHSALRDDPELLRLFPGRVFVEMNGEVAPLTSAMRATRIDRMKPPK